MDILHAAKLRAWFVVFVIFIDSTAGIKWLTVGQGHATWDNRNRIIQCRISRRDFGFGRKQARICRSTFEAMPQVVKAAELTTSTCQNLFKHRRWNCSTILTAPNFTPDLTTGTREQAYVNALSSAAIAYTLGKACAMGRLFNCSCASHPRDPPNGNFKWGGCGDNVRWALQFGKQFTDGTERHVLRERTGVKTKRGSAGPENSLDVIISSMKSNERQASKSQLAVVNLHNNKAGRRAIEMSLKTQCKCHGVSGSCSIKICWKALPRFPDIGERLQRKYGSSVEVTTRPAGSGTKLVPSGTSHKAYNDDDLVYISKSPDYCLRDDRSGSLGTRGRLCNATSSDYDSCDVMCCGRGYVTRTVQKIEMCRCKFHWCCNVVCKKCVHFVAIHMCN